MAEAGQIASFPGVSAAFEIPKDPDLVLPTHQISIDDGVERVMDVLRRRGIIPK
jgi:bifunctional enzyme CysN/CysC